MLNISPEDLDVKLSTFYRKVLLEKDIDLSRAVLRDPTHSQHYFQDIGSFVKPQSFKLKEKIMLAVLHWYCSDEIRFSLNMFLEEHWGRERLELKAVLLSSKRNTLAWLVIQEDFNEHDFFGNYLTKNSFTTFFKLKFREERKKRSLKRYTGWCRGPQDHSSVVDNLTKRLRYRLSEEEYNIMILEELEIQSEIDSLLLRIEEFYNTLIS